MPATDLDLLIAASKEAGAIARHYFGDDPQVWDKGGNDGPVTEADLAVNSMLERDLRAARPSYGWLSEESQDGADRLQAERLFIVDPIDGTRAFIEGSKDWAHAMAVVENGVVTAGAVYLPMRDQLFAAALGQGATLNGEPIAVTGQDALHGATVLGNKWNFEPKYWRDAKTPPVKRHFRSSLAFRLSLVAQGRFDAMITLRPTWEWDVAAGALIVTEAGGTVTDRQGHDPVFNNVHPQLNGMVAGGAVHGPLRAALA
ncbi:3'(2'),5'-bisphosphate nucleotidase CysQ [Yoonia sp. 208BN28-4]|uniref:3'(2'),5'-bisphosphate nucleotidase CysQ n=1 Tax=Yoonia sp. 208BN28-4 TaxID=3126505 RepID=UPI003098FFA7